MIIMQEFLSKHFAGRKLIWIDLFESFPQTVGNDCPTIYLWRKFPAPQEYERLSRERMARSGNPVWEERSRKPDPVEGESEIDFMAEGQNFLLFAEAKLNSDISEQTKYDPARRSTTP